MSQCCHWPGLSSHLALSPEPDFSWATGCTGPRSTETMGWPRSPSSGNISSSPMQGTQEASVNICAFVYLSMRPSGDKKFQEASGNGNHSAAWEGKEAPDHPSRLADKSPQPMPSLTQGSLADVSAGGSSNDKLRIVADFLGMRPTKCCQPTRCVL